VKTWGSSRKAAGASRFPASGAKGKNTKVERMSIPGPGGVLEGLLEWDPRATARLGAIVCHPHPLYGGTMHTKVVFRAAKAALQMGVPVLRFNFRGVGKSEGHYDHGAGERDDVRAALDSLQARLPGTPVCLMGFSLGSWVGLPVGAADRRVSSLIGLGLPANSTNFDFLRPVVKPKLIIQGTQDAYGPRPNVQALFDRLEEPKHIHWVEGADHFFTGQLEEVQAVIRSFVEELLR
jgi:alpha/beta superfamily hydrolase